MTGNLPNVPSTVSADETPYQLSQSHLAKSTTISPIYGFLMSEASIHPTTSHGKSIAHVRLTPSHVNSKGSLHGSVSASMVDWSSGNALATMGRGSGVSVDMHVSFLSAKAKVGDVVVIEGTIDRVGRNLAYTSVRILKEGTDEVITLASHTKFVG
jgi:acyl-coenzyme A thioesterase 13